MKDETRHYTCEGWDIYCERDEGRVRAYAVHPDGREFRTNWRTGRMFTPSLMQAFDMVDDINRRSWDQFGGVA